MNGTFAAMPRIVCSMSTVPNPRLPARPTLGPPLSFQCRSSVRPAFVRISRSTDRRPPRHDKHHIFVRSLQFHEAQGPNEPLLRIEHELGPGREIRPSEGESSNTCSRMMSANSLRHFCLVSRSALLPRPERVRRKLAAKSPEFFA